MAKKVKLNQNRDFLRIRSDEVNIFDKDDNARILKTIDTVREFLRSHKKLVAISAPQLGIRDRIFCMRFEGNDIRTFINPLIISRKGNHLNLETQIGFEDTPTEYFVPRALELTVSYQTPTGKVESNIFSNEASAVFEQMLNMLDGLFIEDFGLEKLPGFDDLTEEEKKEIFMDYAKSLEAMNQTMEEFIKTDKGAKAQNQLTKFYTEYMLGNVEILPMTDEDKARLKTDKGERSPITPSAD